MKNVCDQSQNASSNYSAVFVEISVFLCEMKSGLAFYLASQYKMKISFSLKLDVPTVILNQALLQLKNFQGSELNNTVVTRQISVSKMACRK
jgi:hypothetical protein